MRRSLSPWSEMVITLRSSVSIPMVHRIEALKDVPYAEKLSGSSAKCDVRPREVVHGRFGEHGIILQLRLPERRAVASDQDELSCRTAASQRRGEGQKASTASAQGTFSASRSSPQRGSKRGLTLATAHLLQGRFVAQCVFSRLDDKCQTGRDRLAGLCGL